MIRPAEIRALYDRLQAVKGSTAGLVVAGSIKIEMERLWEKERIPGDELTSAIEHQGGSSAARSSISKKEKLKCQKNK